AYSDLHREILRSAEILRDDEPHVGRPIQSDERPGLARAPAGPSGRARQQHERGGDEGPRRLSRAQQERCRRFEEKWNDLQRHRSKRVPEYAVEERLLQTMEGDVWSRVLDLAGEILGPAHVGLSGEAAALARAGCRAVGRRLAALEHALARGSRSKLI